jgi:hypothetical protein
MQTFSAALIDLVLAEKVDRDVAANAASNRHDFLIALDRAMKEHAVGALTDLESVPDPEGDPEPKPPTNETDSTGEPGAETEKLPKLRVAGT